MKCCVFVGPSLGKNYLPQHWERFEPAQLGSIYHATQLGFKSIVLIDGYFGTVPSVWHKEILYAQSRGVTVFGASSMGALRAAELARFGMVGAGLIFRLYRSGVIVDDDEVCLIHSTKEFGFKPLTVPMINVRITLGKMRAKGILNDRCSKHLITELKRVHFSDRNLKVINGILEEVFRSLNLSVSASDFFENYIDQKQRDVGAVIKIVTNKTAPHVFNFDWLKTKTAYWDRQFVDEIGDVPTPQRW